MCFKLSWTNSGPEIEKPTLFKIKLGNHFKSSKERKKSFSVLIFHRPKVGPMT